MHKSQPLLQQGHLVVLDKKKKIAYWQNVKSATFHGDKLVDTKISPLSFL